MCVRKRRRAISVRSISAPVASPPAWRTRRRECAASYPRARMCPSRSKLVPWRRSPRIAEGPRSAMALAASISVRPAPAVIVSCRCRSGSSSGPTAAAIPPCAYQVLLSRKGPLVRMTIRSESVKRSANESPAMPAPTMTTSASIRLSHRDTGVETYAAFMSNPARPSLMGNGKIQESSMRDASLRNDRQGEKGELPERVIQIAAERTCRTPERFVCSRHFR